METLAVALLVCYLAVIGVVCIYGLHRYWLVWLFLRRRHPFNRISGLVRARVQWLWSGPPGSPWE